MRLPILVCSILTLTQTSFAAALKKDSPMDAYYPSSSTIHSGAIQLEGSASYFQTTGYFDDEGTATSLNEGSGFEKIDGDAFIRYGVSDKLQLDIGARFRQNRSFNTEVDVSSSGLESYTAGAKYSFDPFGRWYLSAELRYRKSAYTNEDFAPGTATPTETLVLGDSGGEATALAHLTWQRTKNHSVSGYLGYNRPGNGLSPELPWNIETAYLLNNWAFRAGVKGLNSMGTSDYSDDPSLKPVQATGETHLFNSINRSFMQPFLGVNYAYNQWRLETTAGRVFSGVSTDQGNEFKVALIYTTGGTTKTEKKVESFKEYQVEGTVLKVSPRNTFVKIDQGTANDIEKGMKFEIFDTDYYGGNEMVATGVAYEVGATWTIIKVLKVYKDGALKKGQTARGR